MGFFHLRRPALVATAGLTVLGLTAAVEGTASAAPRPGTAVNLKFSESLRRTLGDRFFTGYHRYHPRAERKDVVGPTHVYYGKVVGRSSATTVHYAVGDIRVKGDPISGQDGPHIWRKKGHGAWRYVSDTGGALCDSGVPRALLKVWRKPCDW